MASAASLASNLKTAKSVCLDTSATKKGGLFDWKQTKLLISDAMKIPTSKPAFPMVSLGQTAEDGNPSLHTIVVKISGLVNRLTRSGLWRMYYCVLSQTNLTFFSGAANELNGKVEFHITVDQIVSVEDGPDITTKGICTIALRLHGTDSQVVLAVYDAAAREAWKTSLQEVISTSEEYAAKGQRDDVASELMVDPGISVICVSTATKSRPTHATAANPAWGNTVVRMSPSWGDSMPCSLAPGGQIRVWMSNGLVCCLQPERKSIWCDSRTMAPVDQPGYKLTYSLEGLNINAGPKEVDEKQRLKLQMVSYGVLILLLNAVIWGFVSPATSYWLSVFIMMVALAVGALPGPSASQHSHAASAKSNAVSVKLQLQGCEPDISSQVGVSLSRSATMAEAGIISLGPLESKVDGSALDLLKKKFPNESDVKLSRFLVARKHNLQAAIEMMMEDRSLRSSLGAIQPSDALPFLKADLFHFVGPALDGTPVVYVSLKNLSKEEPTETMQKLVLLMCDLAAEIAPEYQCMTILADLQGFTLSKNVDFSKLKDCVKVLNACLPEVLRRVFVCNAPYIFQAVWGFVKELLDPRTSDKVRVLSKKDWPMIQTFIAPELVPKDFGGESTYTYDSASNCLGTLNWGNIEAQRPHMFSALKVSPFGTVVALHHDRTELDLWNFGGGQGAKEDGVPAADDSFGAEDDLCAPDEDELV